MVYGGSSSVGAQQLFWIWGGHCGIVSMELCQLRTESASGVFMAKDVGVCSSGKGC